MLARITQATAFWRLPECGAPYSQQVLPKHQSHVIILYPYIWEKMWPYGSLFTVSISFVEITDYCLLDHDKYVN
jgi:hypothetical protein